MTTELDEKNQRFLFGEDWRVFRYDCADSGYHVLRNAIAGTKSCDFLGVHEQTAYFLEAKDFRGYRIENKKRLTKGELADEVAQKVRDTLAGIVSGCRRSDSQRPWSQLAHILVQAGRQLVVVLCLEDDTATNRLKWQQELDTQLKLIKNKLDWLRCRVRVVSQVTNSGDLPGVVVNNVPQS